MMCVFGGGEKMCDDFFSVPLNKSSQLLKGRTRYFCKQKCSWQTGIQWLLFFKFYFKVMFLFPHRGGEKKRDVFIGC